MRHIRRIELLVVLALVSVIDLGCSNDPDPTPPKQVQPPPKAPELPEDWDHIGISVSTNGDFTNYVISGRNRSLGDAIKVIADRIAKPIKCADDVDASKTLPKIRVEVKNGTTVELLGKLAETFDCVLEETDDSFILKKRPE